MTAGHMTWLSTVNIRHYQSYVDEWYKQKNKVVCVQMQRPSVTWRNYISLSGFRHPGTYPKNPVGFFGYTHIKKTDTKNTHTSTLT